MNHPLQKKRSKGVQTLNNVKFAKELFDNISLLLFWDWF